MRFARHESYGWSLKHIESGQNMQFVGSKLKFEYRIKNIEYYVEKSMFFLFYHTDLGQSCENTNGNELGQ